MDDLIEFVRPLREIDLVDPPRLDDIVRRGEQRQHRARVRRAGVAIAVVLVIALVSGVAAAGRRSPVRVDVAGHPDPPAAGPATPEGGSPPMKGTARWLLGPEEYFVLPPEATSALPHDDDAVPLDPSSEFVQLVGPVVNRSFAAGRSWEIPNRRASATFTPDGQIRTVAGWPVDALSVTVEQLTGPTAPSTLSSQAEFDLAYHQSPDGTEVLVVDRPGGGNRSYVSVVVSSGVRIEVVHESSTSLISGDDLFQLVIRVAAAIDSAGWLPSALPRRFTPVPPELADRPAGSSLVSANGGTIIGYIRNEDLAWTNDPPVYDVDDVLIGYFLPRIGFVDRVTYESPDFDPRAEELAREGPEVVAERDRIEATPPSTPNP